MNRTILDLWVGIFVVLGAVALVFLSFKVGNLGEGSYSKTYTVTGRFDNIGGLKVKAPVKSAGVVVGRVSRIVYNPEIYRAEVSFFIDSKYAFPKDTSASILTSGLLGEQYVGLDPGGDPDDLQDGDQLTLTQSAVILEKLIGQFLFSKASEASDN